MASHEGSCHCGRIAFTLEGEASEALDCNCSMCRRRGSLLAFFPREALALKTPEADMATYTFNRHRLQHHFCPACGIAPFSEGLHPKTGAMMAAVNLRCLPDIDLSTLSVKPFDGASM
jgi:hypothetical protein